MAKSKKDKAGWIVLSRSLLESSIWTTDEPHNTKSAWIDLLLMVNHEDGEIITRFGKVVKIPRGSTFTSIRKLAERWKWSDTKVRRYLDTLTGAHMIEHSGDQTGTLISLVNYENFQGQRRALDRALDRAVDRAVDRRTTMNNNEQQNNKRSRAPVSMKDTMKALDEWARKGGSE